MVSFHHKKTERITMKVIYFDVFAGISGDMCLGALADAGCPMDEVKALLTPLNVPGFDLQWKRVDRGVLSGTKVDVIVDEEPHVHRTLSDVLAIVDRVSWPGAVRDRIEAAFTVLAESEGQVHGKPYDKIHFHEVGSFDAIIDISAVMMGIHLLGVDRCYCSKIHVGEGFAHTRHGTIPVPVPATARMLTGFDLYSTGRSFEMVTPTGASILRVLTEGSSPLPAMKLEGVGYGAGARDPDDLPGMLRVFLGEADGDTNSVTIIECNIDDMNPEFFEPLMERLFEAGALDVTMSPLTMKRNRPATQLSTIVPPALKEKIIPIILQNSTTIGVRFYDCSRVILQRKACQVSTPWGPVQGKVCWGQGIEKRFTPEYGDCLRIHRESDIPISRVYEEASRSFNKDEN